MAGEIIKTEGIVLAIRPWSQTSHVVTWLTPDHGPVTTLVKGAVRVTPLDGNARPLASAFTVQPEGNFATFDISERYRTVWYLVER